MHRTTVTFDTPVERELRKLALKERRSFKELVNELLKQALKTYKISRKPKAELQWNTASGKPVPGFDPSDRSTYLDLISRRLP